MSRDDEEYFKKQFKDLSPKAMVVIALRTAMRSLPTLSGDAEPFSYWKAGKRTQHALAIFRCYQASAVANSLTRPNRSGAEARFARDAARTAADAARGAADAARSAADAALAEAAAHSHDASVNATDDDDPDVFAKYAHAASLARARGVAAASAASVADAAYHAALSATYVAAVADHYDSSAAASGVAAYEAADHYDDAAANSANAAANHAALAAALAAARGTSSGTAVLADIQELKLSTPSRLNRESAEAIPDADVAVLMETPLWLEEGMPPKFQSLWTQLQSDLGSLDAAFDVWIDWYRKQLDGKDWEKELVLPDGEGVPIPQVQPAAIEPVWTDGRLTLPLQAAASDLSDAVFVGALLALSDGLSDFAEDIAGEANIDRRFVAFVKRLADRIPHAAPQQHEVFQLGHIEDVFDGYAKTVDAEWPDFLQTRYHALARQFDRTLRQSPVWRAFKRNAAKATLTTEQVSSAPSLATETATTLRENEAGDFADPAIAAALESLAQQADTEKASANKELPDDLIAAGKEELAIDLIESVNNTLKRIAEAALTAKSFAGAALQPAAKTVGKVATTYAKEFEKGFVDAAKKHGKLDGVKAFKWLRRLAVGGGAYVGLTSLLAKFPYAFAWLDRLLHLIK